MALQARGLPHPNVHILAALTNKHNKHQPANLISNKGSWLPKFLHSFLFLNFRAKDCQFTISGLLCYIKCWSFWPQRWSDYWSCREWPHQSNLIPGMVLHVLVLKYSNKLKLNRMLLVSLNFFLLRPSRIHQRFSSLVYPLRRNKTSLLWRILQERLGRSSAPSRQPSWMIFRTGSSEIEGFCVWEFPSLLHYPSIFV